MKSKALVISKIAVLCYFLNFYFIRILTGSFVPLGTFIFVSVALLGVLISAYREPVRFSVDIKCWIGYFLMSFLTIPIAYSKSYAYNGLVGYLQRLLIIIVIAYICEKEKTIDYAIRLMAITAVACAVSSLLMTEDFSQKLSFSSGAIVSTNDIGSIMAFGCFAILFAFGRGEKSKVYKTIIKMAYIIAAIVVISVAGSRKSILAIFILFAAMFLFCGVDYFKRMTIPRFMGIIVLLIIAFLFVYIYLLPGYEETNLYVRTEGRRAEVTAASDQSRIELYMNAISTFADNIFFGAGFNNFRYINGIYSHSTYAEPLACSGIIGGFLYLGPYIHMLINQVKLSFSNKLNNNEQDRNFQKQMLSFYIAFLFVGVGIPYLYKDIPCIILAMFVAWQNISFEKIKNNSHEIINEVEKNERIADKSFAGNV